MTDSARIVICADVQTKLSVVTLKLESANLAAKKDG